MAESSRRTRWLRPPARARAGTSATRRDRQRTREIERRREVAEGLRDLLAVVNSERSLDEMLEYMVAQAGRLLGGDASAIFLPGHTPGEEFLVIRAASGLEEEFRGVLMPLGASATGLVFTRRRPVIITDLCAALPESTGEGQRMQTAEYPDHIRIVRMDPEVDAPAGAAPGDRGKLRYFASHYGALLAVPLAVKDDTYGTLSLYYRRPRSFSGEEIELAMAFANQAALAIENARLYQRAQQAAALEERQRLARDLHDAVTQTLFSASLIADAIPDLLEIDPAEARRRVEQVRRLTRGALAEMRTLLVELRPGALTELPIGDLLRQLAAACTGRGRAEVSVAIEGQPGRVLPPDVQVALYRIAQETLNNIVKHAQASCVTVTLRDDPGGGVTLVIDDDGQGFDPAAIPAGHLGVGIMRERAQAIGARLAIESRPGAGTRVEVQWPASERTRG